jgi:hypothetical protein
VTNWCSAQLHVTGPEEILKEFAALVESSRERNEGGYVHLLATVIPMPDELTRICMGANQIAGKPYERWYEATADSSARGISEYEQLVLERQCEAADWYSWRQKHWGPGYGMDCDTRMTGTTEDGLRFNFITPYRLPLDMLREVSEAWSRLRLDLDYMVDNGDYGWIRLCDGRKVQDMRGNANEDEQADRSGAAMPMSPDTEAEH